MFEGHHLFCLTSYNPYLGVGGNSPITMLCQKLLKTAQTTCAKALESLRRSKVMVVWCEEGRWGIGHPVCIIQYIYDSSFIVQ